MTEKEAVTENNGQEDKETNKTDVDDNNLDNAIVKQVEFYFGDLNLPRDRFLREQVKLDDGWVPLDILITFKRLAKLTTDTAIIADALAKSNELLEVSEDKKNVRRNPELPVPEMNEERRKELTARTIYAKGFPKDSVLDDLLAFFKNHEEVENLIMRRYQDKAAKKWHFKGSVFATFKTKEQAEKFINTKGVKYDETELLVHWQEDYLKQKQEEYAARKEKKGKKSENKESNEEKTEFKLPAGTVLQFSESNDKTTREEVKQALTDIGAEVAYVDFNVGDTSGWVRLAKENTVKEVFEKLNDGKLKINDKEVIFKIVEGEEEDAYLKRSAEAMTKRRKNAKTFRQGKGRNFKGNHKQHGRKRKQDQHSDAPPTKVKAEDS